MTPSPRSPCFLRTRRDSDQRVLIDLCGGLWGICVNYIHMQTAAFLANPALATSLTLFKTATELAQKSSTTALAGIIKGTGFENLNIVMKVHPHLRPHPRTPHGCAFLCKLFLCVCPQAQSAVGVNSTTLIKAIGSVLDRFAVPAWARDLVTALREQMITHATDGASDDAVDEDQGFFTADQTIVIESGVGRSVSRYHVSLLPTSH
jgi:hypothetical protein